MGDVFFLEGGVDDHFFLLDLRIEEVDGQLYQPFRTFLANPDAKMGQVLGGCWRFPLKLSLSTQKLPVGVFNPTLNNLFITEIIKLFQQ